MISFFFYFAENMVATLWLLSLLSTTLLSTSECVYASPLAKYRLSDTASLGIQVNFIQTVNYAFTHYTFYTSPILSKIMFVFITSFTHLCQFMPGQAV